MATEIQPTGVYRNKRLMHACTSNVGFTVHLQTKDGSVWEGIFNTFSSEFTICLQLAIQIDPKLNPKDCLYEALRAGRQAEKQAFFDLKDIVRMTILDVDLNQATAESTKLATDADISGFDANKSASGDSRQLESWQDDGDNTNAESMLSLDDVALSGNKNDSQNNSRGWDAQEMFRYNERVHKVTTTYDEKLSDYTLPLPKHSSKEWRKKQERAAAIAKEIEGNSKSQSRLAKEDDGDCEEEKFSAVVRPTPPPPTASRPQPPPPTTTSAAPNMCHTNKNFSRPPRVFDRERSRIDSLKNFGSKLSLGPVARQSQNQNHSPRNQVDASGLNNQNQSQSVSHHQTQPHQHQHQHQQQNQKQQPSQQQNQHQTQHNKQQSQQQQHQHPQPQQKQTQPQPQHQSMQQTPHPPSTTTAQVTNTTQQQQQPTPTPTQQTQNQTQAQVTHTPASPASTAPTSTVNTSTLSERSDTSSLGSQAKDHQSELVRKSTLNPNAKEFVYKPRSPAANQAVHTNGANQPSTGVASTIDPANSSPMTPAPHAAGYYQQLPMFPQGLSPHQQAHAAQFMPNHAHPHFQNQIHYMSPVHPHFAQQMSQRYIRGNFQNYHHRGEHHNNVRPDYSQASMMAPTSTGQPFVPPPSGAPHPMNAYAASPQQPMIYSAPHQSMYPVVQASFPQHMPHVMNPPPYDGSTVYMPSQNYMVNP